MLTFTLPSFIIPTFEGCLQLIAVSRVEPSIEYGVVAGRGHSHQMAEIEQEVEIGPAVQRHQVTQEVDHIEGQPAAHKDDHHGYQDRVCAFIPLHIYFVPCRRSCSS